MQARPKPACRLHVVLAAEAEVGVVFRRGPAAWWHILKWDLSAATLDPGAWLRGSLYPTRSALSRDGRVLACFARHGGWNTYLALSKPPWLTALCAWRTAGTWTTGTRFEEDGSLHVFGAVCEREPFHGTCPFPVRFGAVDTNWNRAKEFQYLVHGWKPVAGDESAAAFEPGPYDVTELMKTSPVDRTLVLTRYAEFGSCLYSLAAAGGEETLLADVVWADFTTAGRLAVATAGGELRLYELGDEPVRIALAAERERHGPERVQAEPVVDAVMDRELAGPAMRVIFERDLNGLAPDPVEAPAWAAKW